VLKTFIHSLL